MFYSQKWAICHLHIFDHYIIHLALLPSTHPIRDSLTKHACHYQELSFPIKYYDGI